MIRIPRLRRGALAVAALAVAASVGIAAPAAAHTQVNPSSPEPGSTVTTGPVTVAVAATDPVLEAGQRSIVVRGPGDEELYYGDGCAEISNGTTLSSQITLGEPGEYTVIWTLVAEDGHQQSSTDFPPFTFTWQPAEGEQTADGSPTVPECGAEPPAAKDGAAEPDEKSDSRTSDEADPGRVVQNDHGWEDVGWIVGALAIVFIAAVVVVMIIVRRNATGDDDSERASDERGGDERAGDEPGGDEPGGDGPDAKPDPEAPNRSEPRDDRS